MTARNPFSSILGKTIAEIRMHVSGHSHEFIDTDGNVFLRTSIVGTFDENGGYFTDDTPCSLQPIDPKPNTVEAAAAWVAKDNKRRKRSLTDDIAAIAGSPEHPKG